MILLNTYTSVTSFKLTQLSRQLSSKRSLNTVLLPEKTQVKKQNLKIINNSIKPKKVLDVEDSHLSSKGKFPMWKVMIIKNEEYDKKQVVNKLKNILPFLSMDKCKQYFQEAQTKGSSDIAIVPQEHAEFYVFQLMNKEPIIYSRCVPK